MSKDQQGDDLDGQVSVTSLRGPRDKDVLNIITVNVEADLLSPVSEKNQKTTNNQTTKFQQIQQMFANQLNNANHGVSEGQYNNNNRRELELIRGRSKDKTNELGVNIDVDERGETNGHVPKNLYQLQRAYSQQCEELKALRKLVMARDKRIQELQQEVARLQAAQNIRN